VNHAPGAEVTGGFEHVQGAGDVRLHIRERRERWLLAFWLGFCLLLTLGVSPPALSLFAAFALLPLTLFTLYDLRSYR